MMLRLFYTLIFLIPVVLSSQVVVDHSGSNSDEHFTIIGASATATIYYDANDEKLIEISANLLADDIERITSKRPKVTSSVDDLSGNVIMLGTVEHSALLQEWTQGDDDVARLSGQWEQYLMKTYESIPNSDIEKVLVICGSDKRGVAYGVFSLSREMGVSPWYWWADVAVEKHDYVRIKDLNYTSRSPSVKYRGIFINDEAPALRNWATEKFGGFNHTFYEKVYELILRNKGNYLWPAMWLPSIFNEDDPLNASTAHDYGIVISTSHHEPMMRSHNEWYKFKGGKWDYNANKEKLQEFWRGGIERMQDHESVVTVGMRGDGDEGMSEETVVDLLQAIIKDQRDIIKEVTQKPVEETPQVWAVYKEVQDYYDKGLRVDDDIMVLFCDDNWGNLRILPQKEDLDRKAGYGIYYHFDYVGAPVSYRLLNTTQIERVWEQMNLAYEYGVKDLWLVNVGDIKPMELPISFFLDMAWDVESFTAKSLPDYYTAWAHEQFGKDYAEEVAHLLSQYTKYNARRTPEMLKPDTYSIENYREADRVVFQYQKLLKQSQEIYEVLPPDKKSSFYQLVHFPIELCATLNEMYVAAGKNKYYGERGASAANYYADEVKRLFEKDARLVSYYHEEMNGGKWNHMMSQTHIGYTSWANPPANMMPAVSYIHLRAQPDLDFLVEYGKNPTWGWMGVQGDWAYTTSLPHFDPHNKQEYYLEMINRGTGEADFTIVPEQDWIKVSLSQGRVKYTEKVTISIDWDKLEKSDDHEGSIVLSGTGKKFRLKVPIHFPTFAPKGYIENDGVIAIDAANYHRKSQKDINWEVVENMGRTHSAIVPIPMNFERIDIDVNEPSLQYDFTLFDAKEVAVSTLVSPTQDFRKSDGLHFAIAIDDEEPQIININQGEEKPDYEYADWWMESVADHIKESKSNHGLLAAGNHTLKIWAVDPGVVIHKFVMDLGGLRESYLGPPQSVEAGRE